MLTVENMGGGVIFILRFTGRDKSDMLFILLFQTTTRLTYTGEITGLAL